MTIGIKKMMRGLGRRMRALGASPQAPLVPVPPDVAKQVLALAARLKRQSEEEHLSADAKGRTTEQAAFLSGLAVAHDAIAAQLRDLVGAEAERR